MSFRILPLDSGSPPEPINHDREVAVLNSILDLVDVHGIHFDPKRIEEFDEITSWIAWQLGCFAAGCFEYGGHEKAIIVSHAAIEAAWSIQDFDRLSANLLTLGNIYACNGDYDKAKAIYYHIVELPYWSRTTERYAAHISLGGIYAEKDDYQEAVYHYEIGLNYLRHYIKASEYIDLLKSCAHLYKHVIDIAGALHCAISLKLDDPSILLDEINFVSINIDEIMCLESRLRSFGETDLANVVFERWLNSNNKQKGDSNE